MQRNNVVVFSALFAGFAGGVIALFAIQWVVTIALTTSAVVVGAAGLAILVGAIGFLFGYTKQDVETDQDSRDLRPTKITAPNTAPAAEAAATVIDDNARQHLETCRHDAA